MNSKFPVLNFPPIEARTQINNEKTYIFDILRKKFIFLSPEEWVRQHIIHFLIKSKSYPSSLIKCESGLSYNQLQKRADIIVYDRSGKAFLIVECKATVVKLNQSAFDQVAIYNRTIKAPYIAISNGLNTFVCEIAQNTNSYSYMEDFPAL